jgi:hypothetical protein
MVFYKIYDRQTLKLADTGLVKDYNIDFDYMTNNSSTIEMIRPSLGFKGDLVALLEGAALIALGVVTAIDNGDLKISFKHAKEMFNDKVLNVFLFTTTLSGTMLGKRFDGVGVLKVLLDAAFVNSVDPRRRLPLEVRTFGQYLGAVWVDDAPTIDMVEFIDYLFDHYNIYLDFELDFFNDRIICTIIRNSSSGRVLKDNIRLSQPELDNNELPKENVAVLFNKGTGTTHRTFYLLQNNTLTTNANATNRILPPVSKYIEWDSVEAIREGYTAEELAWSEIGGNIYNHCIKYKLAKNQTMVDVKHFRYGDQITIIYEGRSYESIFTGLKFKKKDQHYTCLFGKTRIDFTDRMKIHNNRRFERRH